MFYSHLQYNYTGKKTVMLKSYLWLSFSQPFPVQATVVSFTWVSENVQHGFIQTVIFLMYIVQFHRDVYVHKFH